MTHRQVAGLTPREENGVAVIRLAGEQAVENVAPLQETLSGLVERHLMIAVDLSATTLLDSTALSVILTAAERSSVRGGELVLVLPESSEYIVRRAVRIAGLDGIVLTFGTTAAARRYLRR